MEPDAWRAFLAKAAHRIRGQVFAARGAVRTLKQVGGPEVEDAVADLEGCLDRMRRIVQQLLTFGRSDRPRLLATRVGPLVSEIVRRFGRQADAVELSTDIAADLPRCALDRDQMDQALGELLENALQHTPAGGRISVSAQVIDATGGPRVRITVADTGAGIPAGRKEDIFAPFVTTRPGGSGLGLPIVRQIVENHGGMIREAGRPGAGARFEILLPTQANHEEAEP